MGLPATFNVSGSLTQITLDNNISSGRTYLTYIRVDGKELIDSNITPFNAPSINSVVKASPEAGFSVFTYTGTGTAGTVGHSLNTVPEFYILKSRSDGEQWAVYHKSITAYKKLVLNSTAGKADTNHFKDMEPTNSLLYIGSTGTVNVDGSTYVGYAFTSVAGFSAFGTYTGNNSTNGPFVYTGFRPAFVMVKGTGTSNTFSWVIVDSTRSTINPTDHALFPNSTENENDLPNFGARDFYIDLLSNGFKLRIDPQSINTDGQEYIYAAFAEHPFKTARAR